MRHLRTRSKELRKAERLRRRAKEMLNDSRYADSGNARKEIERQAEALYREADKLEFGDTPSGDELYF